MKTTTALEKNIAHFAWLWWLAVMLMIAAFVWVRLPLLATYGNEFDEGQFLMTVRLVHDGNPLVNIHNKGVMG